MLKDLKEARDFIHIEVFGLESGDLFEMIFAILEERVKAGV